MTVKEMWKVLIEGLVVALIGAFLFGTIARGSTILPVNDNVTKDMLGDIYTIDGYFSHYGDGAYEWMYVSRKSGKAYKLEGMDSDGYLIWRRFEFEKYGCKAVVLDRFIIIDCETGGRVK